MMNFKWLGNHMRNEESAARDALHLLCGKMIGDGMSRQVYECHILADAVVKIEVGHHSQNDVEWNVWKSVRDTDQARWFAKCLWMSANGQILIMQKTYPRADAAYPKRIPAYFADTKYENFGFVGRQLVCHDYARTNLIENGLNCGMQTAEWWHP